MYREFPTPVKEPKTVQIRARRGRRGLRAGSVHSVRDQAQMLIFESPVVFKTVQMRARQEREEFFDRSVQRVRDLEKFHSAAA